MAKLPHAVETSDGPDSKSLDYQKMEPFWTQVETILGGTDMMRLNADTYLPKYDNESNEDYDERKKVSKFTNIYRDIVENLSQKPFAKQVQLNDDAPDQLQEFADDVDGKGNSLHNFAGDVFFNGINYAVEWILVDFTSNVPTNATRAQEREMGARPFWCRYKASDVLAVESAMINGKEQFTHVRLREWEKSRSGWKETMAERIRVLNREPIVAVDSQNNAQSYGPPTFSVWEKQNNSGNGEDDWVQITPETPMTIGEIPLVPFITGRRRGSSWCFHPPMEDAADLQIELFQEESALKHIKALTAFPMLAANGVTPPTGEDGQPETVRVSPHTVLYAPPEGVSGNAGHWKFIEPSAQSLKFLADDIKDTIKELRELGRQPLTAQSGNLTVVTTAFAAQKGNSAIQAWAQNLKLALENCVMYTAMWLKADLEAEVKIDTDFDLGLGDDDSFEHVLKLREKGEISRTATLGEAKRRGILNADYDPEDDLEEIDEDMEDVDDEESVILDGGEEETDPQAGPAGEGGESEDS